MAGLRDTALKVAKAVADGKLDDAKKLAADIKPAGNADPRAKAGPMPVHSDFDIDTLMQVFKPDRSGGLEWEKKLLTLKDKRGRLHAGRLQATRPAHVPDRGHRPADRGVRPCPDGQEDAGRLDQARPGTWARRPSRRPTWRRSRKPDDKMVKAAVKRLEATCTTCHDKYRDTK